MSLTLPLTAEQPSQLSQSPARVTAPVLRPTIADLVAWAAFTTLLAAALISLNVFAPEALHRALDGLIPMDPTTLSGFTS